MFTMVGLSKTLPDKSKQILKNINLSFYPGAKIGVVGLNGSGKSTLLKIMAGVEQEFDGTARPLPGASIGYLPQEPELEYETVQECIDDAVKKSRAIVEMYTELSMKLADPDLTDEEMTKTMDELEAINTQIEAMDLWELDRVVERAMDSLRLPPPDAKTAVLSGGEKRRVSLCRLLLGSHDMLLLDEPTNHLDAESIAWLEQFLAQYTGTVVCITHDRYFLENVAGWILELDRGEVSQLLLFIIIKPPTRYMHSLNTLCRICKNRAYHMKETIPVGWKQRTNAWPKRKKTKAPLRKLLRLNWNGSDLIQRQRETRARHALKDTTNSLLQQLQLSCEILDRYTSPQGRGWEMLSLMLKIYENHSMNVY